MKVGLIGPYPPPRGGISIHVERLAQALRAQGIAVTVFAIPKKIDKIGRLGKKITAITWLMHFIFCPQMDILHIHLSNWRDRAVIILIARMRKIKTVVTVHSLRDELEQMPMMQAAYMRLVMRQADAIISVGPKENNKLASKFGSSANLRMINPFIAPKIGKTELLQSIQNFMNRHSFIISANGSNMNFFQGQDVYGLDMLVELCFRLTKDYDVGFIFCLTRVTDPAYLQKIHNSIRELHLEASFLLVCDSVELWPILQQSQLFVRPTCTDSYGISIAEAITLGIPSIASDVCQRPEGTILFANRDGDDLYNKVCQVMSDYAKYKKLLENVLVPDCSTEIIKLYRELLSTF
ncbi:MAG: glycosyltransferase family 4 protein [Peptococcaceae bacterium]|nr:glycosyltransferase family 4 protein [Peptococcaceae bacterium]